MYRLLRTMLHALVLPTLLLVTATLGACQPPEDYAAAANGATITGPRNASGSAGKPNCAIDGEVADYGGSHGYAWAYLDTPTIITFARPALIDTVEVIMSDMSLHTYGYRLSLSADGKAWQQVADTTDAPVSGWRMHRFPPVEAGYLRLDFTSTSGWSGSYHIVEMGAFHLGDTNKPGPLGQAWQHARVQRITAHLALLGVGSAQEALQDPQLFAQLKSAADKQPSHRDLSDGTHALFYRDGRAIIVAIDDDGSMTPADTKPDGVNDCLAVDWDADGFFDRTIDYDDTNADGIADTMLQTYRHRSTWGNRPFLVLIRDLDTGPLRLWYLHNYAYWQRVCQWQCDFAGDGYFVMFRRDIADRQWVAAFEAPFCFYDPDADGLPEETVRITATDTTLHSARYSINADNDTTDGQLYDYDVGITCLGRVQLPSDAADTFTTRAGDEAGPFLSWEKARETVRGSLWQRALLIWDENDHNVAARAPDHERWEGLLNSRYRGFPQEGGPPCGTINKRYELDADFSGKMRLYYWPADGRLHLHGAEQGTLLADYDHDGRADLVIEYLDTDADGCFDTRKVSYPSSGLPARTITGPTVYQPPTGAPVASAAPVLMPFRYAAIAKVWPQSLADRIAAGSTLLEALSDFAARTSRPLFTAPMDFYEHGTRAQFPYVERLRASREAKRFYQDIAIELAFAHLVASAGKEEAPELKRARRLHDCGRLTDAAEALSSPGP